VILLNDASMDPTLPPTQDERRRTVFHPEMRGMLDLRHVGRQTETDRDRQSPAETRTVADSHGYIFVPNRITCAI